MNPLGSVVNDDHFNGSAVLTELHAKKSSNLGSQ
jgi:hypothetical protein